jgi:hypothetical protein
VLATLLVVAMPLLFVGCQSSAPGRGLLRQQIHPESDVSANAEQARLRIRVLVEPFCGRVASTADQIRASTTNQTIRREALLWKIQAVPIMRETLFHENPYIALGDTWAFLTQMDGYFQSGPGRQALGDSAPIAAAACASLEKQLTEVAASFTHSGNVTDVRTFIQKWAANHPIKHSIAGRESVVSYFTRRNLQETFSAPEAASDFVVTMNDLSRHGESASEACRYPNEFALKQVTRDCVGAEQQRVCDKISLEQLVENARLAAEIAANPPPGLAQKQPALRSPEAESA